MKTLTIEQRVAALEQELSDLKEERSNGRVKRVKDWRRTIGQFTDKPEMKELFAEAMKLRDADRRKAHGGQPRKRPAGS
jgi:hypothetical protein